MKKKEIECDMCGVCCEAYSISSLNKKAGEKCLKLQDNGKCSDYENRPKVCRDFKADNFCMLLTTLSKKDKLKVIKEVFDL